MADDLQQSGREPANSSLGDLASRLSRAEAHLAAATRALAHDRKGRGAIARLADAASTTGAEKAVAEAQADLARCRAEVGAAARSWMRWRTRELLAQDRAAPPWSAAQSLRHLDRLELLPRLRQWQALATEAVAVMERGAARCRPAADREFHQQVFALKPSLSSLGVSGLARACIGEAIEAARRLRTALPEEEMSVDLSGLDDVFRRLFAYLHQPVFEVESWRDINKHEQVADKLALMAQMLRPLSIHLGQLADSTEKELIDGAEESETFLAPYREVARAELPEALLGAALNDP